MSSINQTARKDIFSILQGKHLSVVKPDPESESGQKIIPCHDIRGALVWPTEKKPAYYCLFGQRTDINNYGKLPLLFVIERTAEWPRELFMRMLMDSRVYQCRLWYNDMKPENMDLMSLFYDFCRYQKANDIEIDKAPIVGKFHIGIRFIKEWMKTKSIEGLEPGTILYRHLYNLARMDLGENPEEKYYALVAMQYIVASIEKTPWNRLSAVTSGSYQRSRERAHPDGWT